MKTLLRALLLSLVAAGAVQAQAGILRPKVDLAFNRFYPYAEILAHFERLREAYPTFIRIDDIGASHEGRPLRVIVLTNQATGPDTGKVAMWIDANVHGNEVQGTEAILYLAWWLLERYETNQRARELLDGRVLYLLPSQNPDGRDHWFESPNTSSSSRSGTRPYDDDRDGLFDEDGPDDLDGDGEITQMRKQVPPGTGNVRLDADDPRVILPPDEDHPADYLLLGLEGIDNDGDGRVNEDSVGGYDMNRNWPSDWRPGHQQRGAGDYPLCFPETRAVADYILAHPNIAAVQSFHNSGGMILRGPGDESVQYPRSDVAVYDRLGADGESILPFYDYMIIWRDLYTVHGGFVNWTYEGLGIFSFTNEMWAGEQYDAAGASVQRGETEAGEERPDPRGSRNQFNDRVLFGDAYVEWHPVQHPLYGEIEVGGFKREFGRVPPSFMIEEMLHRNAMFCLLHAEAIAEVVADPLEIEPLGDDLYRVTATFRNPKLMPTRSAMAASRRVGTPDRVTIRGDNLEVIGGGQELDRFRPEQIAAVESRPERLLLESGVGGEGYVRLCWIVRGSGEVTVGYEAEKADDVSVSGTLAPG